MGKLLQMQHPVFRVVFVGFLNFIREKKIKIQVYSTCSSLTVMNIWNRILNCFPSLRWTLYGLWADYITHYDSPVIVATVLTLSG